MTIPTYREDLAIDGSNLMIEDPELPIFRERRVVRLSRSQLHSRSFLLGNGSGFMFLAPVELNFNERTMVPSKWFGASGIGRKYLESTRVWYERAGQRSLLSRKDQTGFEQDLVEAIRIYNINAVTVRQRFFVPTAQAGLVMVLESDLPATFIVQPQFDMRYYQSLDEDMSAYKAEVITSNGIHRLTVGNRVDGPNGTAMTFHSTVSIVDGPGRIELVPEASRMVKHVYLKAEHREKLIHTAYAETREQSPDEAPIWDSYENTVFAPAQITVNAPATIVYAFDADADRAETIGAHIAGDVAGLYRTGEEAATDFLQKALFRTGNEHVDLAYNQVLTRFNQTLVARNVEFVQGPDQREQFTGILAGDKYFMDAWKRDENISLEALMLANDFEPVRAILCDTWRYQDERTGRLPHIIQLGQPLVYYSSDGTLWALRRLAEYTRMSGDISLLDDKFQMVEHFFQASLAFLRRGLLPSGGTIKNSYLWETWEDTGYTPRNGYPIEIELLWLQVLRDQIPTIRDRNQDLAAKMESVLEEGCQTFENFYLDGYLADSLDYDFRPRERLTPNGYIAFTLEQPLPADLARQMVLVARDQLAGRIGVKSLATRDWPKVFSEKFLNDPRNVRDSELASVGIYNYHRGVEWLWLNQYIVAGELACGDADIAYKTYIAPQVRSAIQQSGVGGLDELNDMHGPLGADFQAWSMAGFVAALNRFAGVTVDASEKRIVLRPSIPSAWPELYSRHRVDDYRFDLRVQTRGDQWQEVVIHPLDPLPSGYRAEVGVRLHRDDAMYRIRVNGEVAGSQSRRVQYPVGEADPGEVWVDTPLDGRTVIEFEPET